MIPRRTGRGWRWVGALLVSGTFFAHGALDFTRSRVEPQWLRLQLTRTALGVYGEGDYDVTTFGGGDKVTYQRYFLGPELELDMIGSVYHPNLCTFSFVSEGAYGRTWESVDSSTSSSHTEDMGYLGRARFNANFLNNKPYNAGAFAGVDHSYRDYDFFNRVTVDSRDYGARAGYDQGPWSIHGTYTHRLEDVSGTAIQAYGMIMDAFGLSSSHLREQGSTTLTYDLTQYDYSGAPGFSSETDTHSVALTDTEEFGSRKQFNLNTRAGYISQESDTAGDNNQWLVGADLTAIHPRNLRSDYSVSMDRYESGDFTSSVLAGRATVYHQLYQSLGSSISLFGGRGDYSDQLSDGFNDYMGVTWGEDYTKRIGSSHVLQINNSLTFQRTDQEGIATVENERHMFSSAGNPPDAFDLAQPYVAASSIRVRNATTSQPYYSGLDYDIIVNGSVTRLQRRPTGGIPDGTAVLVDYEAEPRPADAYNTVAEYFRVRIDLWNNLWGLYASIATSTSDAAEEVYAGDYTRLTLGSDVNWRWLSAGVEFEDYSSVDSSYQSIGLFQAANLSLGESGSCGIHLSERRLVYDSAGYTEDQYRFTFQYYRQFTGRLGVNLHAGASYRTGRYDDETLAVFRPSLRYRVGRTTISAEYNMEYSLTGTTEERFQNSIHFSLIRSF